MRVNEGGLRCWELARWDVDSAVLDVTRSFRCHGDVLGCKVLYRLRARQIGLSVLVLRSITKSKLLYLGAAIAGHFLVDFATVYASQFGIFAAEGVVTVFGVVALYYVLHELRKGRIVPVPMDTMPPPVNGVRASP